MRIITESNLYKISPDVDKYLTNGEIYSKFEIILPSNADLEVWKDVEYINESDAEVTNEEIEEYLNGLLNEA